MMFECTRLARRFSRAMAVAGRPARTRGVGLLGATRGRPALRLLPDGHGGPADLGRLRLLRSMRAAAARGGWPGASSVAGAEPRLLPRLSGGGVVEDLALLWRCLRRGFRARSRRPWRRVELGGKADAAARPVGRDAPPGGDRPGDRRRPASCCCWNRPTAGWMPGGDRVTGPAPGSGQRATIVVGTHLVGRRRRLRSGHAHRRGPDASSRAPADLVTHRGSTTAEAGPSAIRRWSAVRAVLAEPVVTAADARPISSRRWSP